MTALLLDIAFYLTFLFAAGVIYVIIRIVFGPGRYAEIAQGLTGALFIIPLCVGVFVGVARMPELASGEGVLMMLIALSLLVFTLWIVWISLYALWISQRLPVEVDAHGIRLASAFYQLIPWVDVVSVGNTVSMWQEVGPFLFLAESRGIRTVIWPFRSRRLGLHIEIADIIRSHPNYCGKAVAE